MVFILIGIVILCIASIVFRTLLFNAPLTIFYAVRDTYYYFKRKSWNICPTGQLICYFAHFGGGKTLSATNRINRLYRRYNDKLVYCRDRNKMVTQKIEVLSNAEFTGIPYVPLKSLKDITARATHNKGIDMENDTLTVTLILIDEASSELNSRDFKTNYDADAMNTLITSRHYHLNLYYTSQKFKLTDALLRAVTQECIKCRKVWRIMVQTGYDADQLEVAGDALLVKPLWRKAYFITNKVFNGYDTLATVERLKKGMESGNVMSAAEILALRGNNTPDVNSVSTPSRRLKRRWIGGKK